MNSAIKWVVAVAAALPAATALAQGGPAPVTELVLRREPPPPNPWNVSFGTLLWTRTSPSGPIFVDRTTGAAIVDTADVLSFGATAGPYASIGRWLDRDWKLEGAFFGVYEWRTAGGSALDATTAPAAVLAFPNFTVAGAPALTFNAGDTQRYDYRSSLTNAEINVYNIVSSSVRVLGGFRYLNLTENFNMVLTDRFGARFGDAAVATTNNLFGGQVGVDYGIPLFGVVQLSGVARFGVFGGVESQTTAGTFLDVAAADPRNAPAGRSATGGQVAFVGQLGFHTSYQITPNIAVRAGYEMVWVENVALAPRQIAACNWAPGGAGGVNTRGNVFLNGAVAGFDLKF